MPEHPAQEGTTVRSALRDAARVLRAAQVESPELTAEILLGHVLSWDRVRVLTRPDSALAWPAASRLGELVRRRAAGEPLQYLTGVQEFYGLSFRVTPAVLIPRPETEILVEKVALLAHSLGREDVLFVDVGTGSGCIAVALAHGLSRAKGFAVDISSSALAVAQANAAVHGVGDRVRFVQADLLECFAPAPTFDFVVSNPPYVASTDAAGLSPTVREHEPHVALFAGTAGMEVYSRLIPQAWTRLRTGGRLALEIGAGMLPDVTSLLGSHGLRLEVVHEDLQGIPRCLIARRNDG